MNTIYTRYEEMHEEIQSFLMSKMHSIQNLMTPILQTIQSQRHMLVQSVSKSEIQSFCWKHIHFLPILILVWPIVLTILLALASTSTWLFWLLTSLVVGLIQFIYVLYQFAMISMDIVVLSVLKTFALMRSQIRYYTIKSGLSRSHSFRNGRNYVSRRGRRREWRSKLNKARNYEDFLEIEIEDPMVVIPSTTSSTTTSHDNGNNDNNKKKKQHLMESHFSSSTNPRRSQSCINLQQYDYSNSSSNSSSNSNSNSNPKKRGNDKCPTYLSSPGTHSPSSFIMPQSPTSSQLKKVASSLSLQEYNDIISKDENSNDIQRELGNNGAKILATILRLREARMQAKSSLETDIFSNGGTHVQKIQEDESSDDNNYCDGPIHDADGDPHEEQKQDPSQRQQQNHTQNRECGTEHHYHHEDKKEEDKLCISKHATTTTTTTTNKHILHTSKIIINGGNLLKRSICNEATSTLKLLLSGVVKRNHLQINNLLIDNARSVMECGQHRLSEQSRDLLTGFNEELEQCLEWISHSHVSPVPQALDEKHHQVQELSERLNLVRKIKHNFGRTALMLSGGGAQAMYHLGTIKALCESNLYDNIPVISGTSGGSITAAMCAIKTQKELLDHVCVPVVSTDYGNDGSMKEQNIRWFPKVVDMGAFWLKNRLLVDSKEFKRCCDYYYGDITFEEAFQKTGKHVCITVSASRAESGAGGGAQRLLLNHISTPHVTLASAVAASCALPGVMAPAKLITKNSHNNMETFEADGVEWIDGSIQADLPFKRISTLFNVSNFIVCQTNFHVVPFLHKAHHPNQKSFYWRVFQTCEWDMRNRVLNLSRLGLFPKIFGQDVSKVFKQKYHGDLTLVPHFTTMQVFGLKSLVNPSVEDMEIYLQNGQSAAWPYLSIINEMVRIESTIDKCVFHLRERLHDLSPDQDMQTLNDDIESISSSIHTNNFRIMGKAHETELLKQKVGNLESENIKLKKKINELYHMMETAGKSSPITFHSNDSEDYKKCSDHSDRIDDIKEIILEKLSVNSCEPALDEDMKI